VVLAIADTKYSDETVNLFRYSSTDATTT